MKRANLVFLLLLGGMATQAFADDSATTVDTTQTPVDTYSYSTTLDIHRVISVSDTGDECGPVPKQMLYEDSHGQRRILQYQVMGSGCSNG